MTKLKEECGVFGIFDAEEASVLTTLGLHSLQHRGQEGAGIVSYDGKNWEVYSEPIEIKKNKKIYFKAVRYGWKESETKIVKF